MSSDIDILARLIYGRVVFWGFGREWESNVVRDAAAAIEQRDAEIVRVRAEVKRLRSWIDRQEPRKVYEATVCPICHRATEYYYMRPVEDHATGCPWREASREQ